MTTLFGAGDMFVSTNRCAAFIDGNGSQVGESGHKQLDSNKYTVCCKGKDCGKNRNVTKLGRHQGLLKEKG